MTAPIRRIAPSEFRVSPAARSLIRDILGPAGDWREQAICAQTDPDAFFPEKGGRTQPAIAICKVCPVRQQCLDYALDTAQMHGVWGGVGERKRRRLMRERAAKRLQQRQTQAA